MKTGPGPDRKVNRLPKQNLEHRQSFPVEDKNQRDADDQFIVQWIGLLEIAPEKSFLRLSPSLRTVAMVLAVSYVTAGFGYRLLCSCTIGNLKSGLNDNTALLLVDMFSDLVTFSPKS